MANLFSVLTANDSYLVHTAHLQGNLHEVSCQNDGLSCFVLQQQVPCSSSGIWVHS